MTTFQNNRSKKDNLSAKLLYIKMDLLSMMDNLMTIIYLLINSS